MLTLDLRHVSANDSAVAGQVSNFATVAMTVTFIAVGRIANRDDFALLKNTSRTYNVMGNEIASVGRPSIRPPSSSRRPVHRTALPNGDGTVTYTPLARYVGVDNYEHTVANRGWPGVDQHREDDPRGVDSK